MMKPVKFHAKPLKIREILPAAKVGTVSPATALDAVRAVENVKAGGTGKVFGLYRFIGAKGGFLGVKGSVKKGFGTVLGDKKGLRVNDLSAAELKTKLPPGAEIKVLDNKGNVLGIFVPVTKDTHGSSGRKSSSSRSKLIRRAIDGAVKRK